jgi:hypothetical protein
MAFKRALSPTFPAQVTVNVPAEKGGFDKNTFEAVFRRPMPIIDPETGKPMLFDDPETGNPTTKTTLDTYKEGLGDAGNDKQFLRDWMVGWTLKDEDTKQDVPFDPVELEALLSIEPTPSATVTAFYMAYRGIKAKN